MSTQLDEVNTRIDAIIRSNSHIERAVLGVLVISFLAGLFALVYGALLGNRWIVGAGVGADGLMCWSGLKIVGFYEVKLCVALVPQMSALLSERDAALQVAALIRRLIEKL